MLARLIDRARQSIPFFGSGKRPRPQQVLVLRPIRNPRVKWERSAETGLVVVTLAHHPYKRWDKLIGKIFQIPTERRIEMTDELSSLVWELCDGAHTVASIANQIAKEYKLTQRQAEVSVLAFLNTLQGKRLVGVPPEQSEEINKGADPRKTERAKGNKGFYATRKYRPSSDIARKRGHQPDQAAVQHGGEDRDQRP
ncbi:MAG: PqqD family protein [Capsulimonadaceae bacterium]|nr:PqqD family protein [Capsulimonadaceae bacterium]